MTTEIHNRAEAHRRLIALGMPADLAADCLDHEQVRYANASNYPGAWSILEAYRRYCAAHEGIVERAIRLDREATARACRPDLAPAEDPLDTVPPEERERVVAVAQKAAEHAWRFAGDSAKEPEYCAAIAREVAAYHTRTGGPEFQPGYHHPDPVIDQEVRLDLADGRAIDKAAGIREGWHRGWTVDGLRSVVADKAAQVSEDVIGQALTVASGAQAVDSFTPLEAQIREQDAEIDRWKTAVVSKAAERDVAVTENSRLKAEVERLTAKLAGIEGVAAQGDGMMVTISEQAATIERLTAELAGQTKAAIDWREAAKRHMARAEALRPGLTEEQALATAGPLSRDIYNRIGLATGNKIGAPEWMRDAIAAALLRASRAAPAAASALPIDHPGVRDALRALAVAMCATHARDPEQKAQLQRGAEAHDALRYALGDKDPAAEDAIPPVRFPGDVAIPRAILEKLTKAAASDPDAREARWAAERILQRATLAAEPARTDPERARARREPIEETEIGDEYGSPQRVLCPTCERWHFPTDCCQA